ncbi:hypothetical protein PsorP6_002893 [Peronosclerospora sorghi]|uniref:Uncharacterized protein n=1 Tax=Peronosclerospora sorghi TaxID=230839 RepID=A0ACC0VN16_9STRA|nr:hypothetical protein PsorP6_002893 [Peronosclerospora sorghi]
MVPFPSNTFYEGELQNGVSSSERQLANIDFPWPNPNNPTLFYIFLGSEGIILSGTSYLNRTEASSVEKIVTRFLKAGVLPAQIGVVTPYEGQRAYIVIYMQRNVTMRPQIYRDAEVASADSFQGWEKDLIILSSLPPRHHGRAANLPGNGSTRRRDAVPPLDSHFDPRYDQSSYSSFDALGAGGLPQSTTHERGGPTRGSTPYGTYSLGPFTQDGLTQASIGLDVPFTQMAQTQYFSQLSQDKFAMSQDSFGYEHDYKSQNMLLSQDPRLSGNEMY